MHPSQAASRRQGRLLPTIVVLTLGFAILLAGLIALWRVFHRERNQARDTLAQTGQTLEHYARQALGQRFDRDLRVAGADAEAAFHDPLLATGHLLWLDGGRQLLPRPVSPVPGSATPATELHEASLSVLGLDRELAGAEAGAPWRRRLQLHRQFLNALQGSKNADIETAFRDLLRHRARFRTAPERDLPATLALLRVFHRDSSPAPELLRALLVDGLDDGQGGELESLSRLLLEHRNRFTVADFRFLCQQLVELAAEAELPYQDFLERSLEQPTAVPSSAEVKADAPEFVEGRIELLDAGHWLVRREPGRGLIGVRLELDKALHDVAGEMRRHGLLADDDEIRPPATLRERQRLPVDELRLEIDSARWPRQAADIEARYRLKAGLLLLSAALAAAMAILAAVLRSRRFRLVELKSEFIATVSHELRTPLASIRLLAETVARRARARGFEAADLKDYPDRIVREIDGLSFLVENILSFNRLERQRVEPRRTRVSLRELIDQVRREVEPIDRRVEIEAPGADVILDVDRELFRLLLLNLARNAALYNDRDPVTIAFEYRPLDGGSEILVRDNGRGIAAAERDKVFDEFYRPRDSTRSSRGTGLGLTICRRIAELHHGRLGIVNSSSDGTTFRIELPATTGAIG